MKETEICQLETNVEKLEVLSQNNPNNRLYEMKYKTARKRLDNLLKTSNELKHIEFQFNKL